MDKDTVINDRVVDSAFDKEFGRDLERYKFQRYQLRGLKAHYLFLYTDGHTPEQVRAQFLPLLDALAQLWNSTRGNGRSWFDRAITAYLSGDSPEFVVAELRGSK